MARLPTVVLQHPRKGTRIVNEYDYAQDLGGWARRGWSLVTTRRGDATLEEERMANREAKIQQHRTHHPDEVRFRRDAERTHEAQRIVRPVGVAAPAPAPEPESEAEASQEAPEVEYDPNWREMPFFKRKQYVRALTGKMPAKASDADRIMAAWLEENPQQ